MKKNLYLKLCGVLLFLLMVNPQVTFSQGGSYNPSAEGQALINSIQNGVQFNGAASISIPIHSFSYKGITIPMQLSYQASGIKVDDMPTSVGLGWRSSVGGKITRIVKNKHEHYTSSPGIDLTAGLIGGLLIMRKYLLLFIPIEAMARHTKILMILIWKPTSFILKYQVNPGCSYLITMAMQ